MDGWMDGRIDGWMVGWLVGWMDGWIDRYKHNQGPPIGSWFVRRIAVLLFVSHGWFFFNQRSSQRRLSIEDLQRVLLGEVLS